MMHNGEYELDDQKKEIIKICKYALDKYDMKKYARSVDNEHRKIIWELDSD